MITNKRGTISWIINCSLYQYSTLYMSTHFSIFGFPVLSLDGSRPVQTTFHFKPGLFWPLLSDWYLPRSIYHAFLAKLDTVGKAEPWCLHCLSRDKLLVDTAVHIKYQMTWVFSKDKRRQRSLWAEAMKTGNKRNEVALVGVPALSQRFGRILFNLL